MVGEKKRVKKTDGVVKRELYNKICYVLNVYSETYTCKEIVYRLVYIPCFMMGRNQ